MSQFILKINSTMKLKEVLLEHMVTHLLQLVKKELDLADIPKIILIDDEPAIGGGSSFGEFDGDIRVVTKGRHPVDVMRTLAPRISSLEAKNYEYATRWCRWK